MRWCWLLCLAACGGDSHHVDVDCAAAVVYLDRFGGTYTQASADDAAFNASEAVDGTRVLGAYSGSDQDWTDLTECIRAALAPFDTVVTEDDPGMTPHVELVFTDRYWVNSAVTNIYPQSCEPGHQIEFIFGDALASPTRGCEVTLAGLAYMLGELGPSENCLDYTSPAMDCGERSFLAVDSTCVDPATNEPAPCRCDASATTQNSAKALAAIFHPCT
ncbi:MAG: hypothetical protein QM831_10115 [Kofleriaceae bacterium]